MTASTVLITGATDGIGLALARRLHATGARLVLVGRRALETLEDPLFSETTYCQVDLAEADPGLRIQAWLEAQGITHIERLFHNAAIGSYGHIPADEPDVIRRMVAVNLVAPIAITHALAPHLERAAGRVVFVSSVAVDLPCADYALYGATKAALDGFARSVGIEWQGRIGVQAVHPGAVRTGFHAKAGVPAELVASPRIPTADDVAAQLERLAETSRRAPSVGGGAAFLRFVGRRLGGPLERAMRRKRGSAGAVARRAARVLVTGAAQGIGRAVAEAYVARGVEVVGVDVDVVEAPFPIEACDLADAEAIAGLLARLASQAPFDLVVHNAGINVSGHFERTDLAAQERMLAINFTAPLLLTAGLLKAERVAAGGTVAFVSSLSHQVGYPGAAVYAASKDGLTHYARSLFVALGPQDVNVLTVFPGPTRTAQAREASPPGSDESKRMPPADLAAALLAAVDARKRRLVPGFGNKVFAWLGRTVPAVTERGMRKAIYEQLP